MRQSHPTTKTYLSSHFIHLLSFTHKWNLKHSEVIRLFARKIKICMNAKWIFLALVTWIHKHVSIKYFSQNVEERKFSLAHRKKWREREIKILFDTLHIVSSCTDCYYVFSSHFFAYYSNFFGSLLFHHVYV